VRPQFVTLTAKAQPPSPSIFSIMPHQQPPVQFIGQHYKQHQPLAQEVKMLEITAICKTVGCSHENIPSIFISDVTATMCAGCETMIEDVTTKEITDGIAETE
jgi:hypothetical protein